MAAMDRLKSLALKPAPMAMPMEEESTSGPDSPDLLSAAQNLISAIKSGSASSVAEALHAAYESCSGETEKPSEGEEY